MKNNRWKWILIICSWVVIIGLGITALVMSTHSSAQSEAEEQYNDLPEGGAESPEKAVENAYMAIAAHDSDKLLMAMFPKNTLSYYDAVTKKYWGMSLRNMLAEYVVSDPGTPCEIQITKNEQEDEDLSPNDRETDYILGLFQELYGVPLKYNGRLKWMNIRYNVKGLFKYEMFDDWNKHDYYHNEDGFFREILAYESDGKWYCVDVKGLFDDHDYLEH